MNEIDFSIVVPFFNKGRTIESSIRSFLAQDYPEDRYEIIYVDNNSTDDSCALVEKYPRVRLIREKRQGAYVSRNTGALSSRGSYLIFSDADVVAPSGWLSSIKSAVIEKAPDILIGWYLPAADSRLMRAHSQLVCERIKIALNRSNPGMVTASASNLAIRKSVFEDEGMFLSLPRSEDKFFVLRCLEKGRKIHFDQRIGVVRNDIGSLGAALMKNFTYGYANALYIDRRITPLKWIIWDFLFKQFPAGAGLLLFSLFYYSGYCLGRLKNRMSRVSL
jgi:glycosyltransferase involved in cell wall biosynthesis